ncbi:MAG: hypothetical protein PHC54_00980 [Candidatus Omnitrophica bacterium]|nr:hypothetical protein [Candidatus Omnitrophota bacterium]MDD5591847.1 hypothetical protein [Candidatus Omnitrophota bacterium]
MVILDNSEFAKCLRNLFKAWQLRTMDYKSTSATIGLLVAVRRNAYLSPVKTASIIMVVVILTNTIFSVLVNKDMVLTGWIIRGMLLSTGLAGLFCEVGPKTLASTSLFLKLINHYKRLDVEEK